jgi:redox-sensitive bicupin YhaK (pirin superfamily)
VRDIGAEASYFDVSVPPGSTIQLPCAGGLAAFAYVYAGEGVIGGTPVAGTRLVLLRAGDGLVATATAGSLAFLLIAGRPIREPIARHGPFVMNTREEIEETLRELRAGTFIR